VSSAGQARNKARQIKGKVKDAGTSLKPWDAGTSLKPWDAGTSLKP
jgi:hypothetical protein